jgi:hypothetical protein
MQDETSGHIGRLLGLLPGVALRDVWTSAQGTIFTFSTSSISSLSAIVYCVEGGNAALRSMTEAATRPISGWADPANLRFDLVVSTQDRLELVGVYLVWYLYDARLLELGAANQLLEAWGGARVPDVC